jgi:hypothetical protein
MTVEDGVAAVPLDGRARWDEHASPRGGRRGWFAAIKWTVTSACFVGVLLSVFGSRIDCAPQPVSAQSRIDADTRLLDDAPIAARLERSPTAAGGELLRGETRIIWAGDGVSAHITEKVELDPSGRLERADIETVLRNAEGRGSPDNPVEHMTLDATRGVVVVARGAQSETRSVDTDLPWVFASAITPNGATISTPVAAIAAKRAAERGGAVRLFDARGTDVTVMSDQVLVTGGGGSLVVLGDDVATFGAHQGDDDELLRMRVGALGVEMTARH